MPIFSCVCVCVMPSRWYSMGSSTVEMFIDVLVELAERGVQGGRLTRAGRAGDQHDAVGRVDLLLPDVSVHLVEAELLELDVDGLGVEDTHDRLLAVAVGEGGHTQVELAALHGAADAAVLRHAALGDVQVRHDLQAAGDGGGHARRGVHHLEQLAVDAEADLELLLAGLDVDVAGALLDGGLDDVVDVADDRETPPASRSRSTSVLAFFSTWTSPSPTSERISERSIVCSSSLGPPTISRTPRTSKLVRQDELDGVDAEPLRISSMRKTSSGGAR
jgi:hypothetical protein